RRGTCAAHPQPRRQSKAAVSRRLQTTRSAGAWSRAELDGVPSSRAPFSFRRAPVEYPHWVERLSMSGRGRGPGFRSFEPFERRDELGVLRGEDGAEIEQQPIVLHAPHHGGCSKPQALGERRDGFLFRF